MTTQCMFCNGPVNPYDESTYALVSGWVHGKKRDSMTLREDMGQYAHEHCILKAKGGQAADQQSLLGDEPVVHDSKDDDTPDDLITEIFESVAPPPTVRGLGQMLGLAPKENKPNPLSDKLADDMDHMAFGHEVGHSGRSVGKHPLHRNYLA